MPAVKPRVRLFDVSDDEDERVVSAGLIRDADDDEEDPEDGDGTGDGTEGPTAALPAEEATPATGEAPDSANADEPGGNTET